MSHPGRKQVPEFEPMFACALILNIMFACFGAAIVASVAVFAASIPLFNLLGYQSHELQFAPLFFPAFLAALIARNWK